MHLDFTGWLQFHNHRGNGLSMVMAAEFHDRIELVLPDEGVYFVELFMELED